MNTKEVTLELIMTTLTLLTDKVDARGRKLDELETRMVKGFDEVQSEMQKGFRDNRKYTDKRYEEVIKKVNAYTDKRCEEVTKKLMRTPTNAVRR